MTNSRHGFTLIELLMVVAIVAIAIALLFPAAQSAREAARRVQCANNLKQVGLAMHDYHDQHGTLPPGVNGCCGGTWLLFVLPGIEQSSLYNSWNFTGNNRSGEQRGREIFGYSGAANATVTGSRVSVFYCPTDPNNRTLAGVGRVTSQNYVVNFGNTISNQPPFYQYCGRRIPFLGAPFGDVNAPALDASATSAEATGTAHPGTFSFAGITDGLSGTFLTSEVLVGTGGDLRGFSWWGYAAMFTGLLPPNSPSPDVMPSSRHCGLVPPNPPCSGATGGQTADGTYVGLGLLNNPRSKHPGGVTIGMADGSVRFVRNSVCVFVFQALSSTSGSETMSSDSY
jgi:prepilin-type N-terminal cleavage/methylation domain-containing protein/prepilin-type processing-associated H-X9-DG protein